MKILHLTHTDVRVDSRILKELGALEAAGIYEMHAIGVAAIGANGGIDFLQGTQVHSVRAVFRCFRWIPVFLRHPLTYLEILLRVMAAGRILRPQLVHCHDTPMLPVAVLLAKLCGAKVIYDAHELESKKNGQTAWISLVTYFLEKILWGRVDGFVTVSESIMHWYKARFATKESALILNSPVIATPAKHVSPTKSYFHQKYGIPEECLLFVYLGLFVPGRGIEKLIEVFSELQVKAHLIFIGQGPLQRMIENHAEHNARLHLHDAVPHDQVVSLVTSADYGLCLVERVSLSDYYSLPNKLFEYAFAGLPVLASNFPDIQKFVERFKLGACTADDKESITRAVLQLQTSGGRRVTADLTPLGWVSQAENLRELYRRVLRSTQTHCGS